MHNNLLLYTIMIYLIESNISYVIYSHGLVI